MTDIQTRPFSKNYRLSAHFLVPISVLYHEGIAVLCVSGQELLKRRRRGKARHNPPPGVGSKESWECGYLYQTRSWARFPSPPLPTGYPLSWVRPVVQFPEDKLRELRGIDATVYVRFLRGCFWYALLHLLTTFPILFPIHIDFSEHSISPKSMTRASISSLVGTAKGRSLLWIHICLLLWLSLSWVITLVWVCNGAFKMRAENIRQSARRAEDAREGMVEDEDEIYYRNPRPQYDFIETPSKERDRPIQGLRLRTVMVTNIPQGLRNEKVLQEYFEYFMSRKVEKPAVGITSSTQPGFFNKSLAFLLNRAKRLQVQRPRSSTPTQGGVQDDAEGDNDKRESSDGPPRPVIERVVIARKMTELASLLERREQILVLLETAHVKLANKALLTVKNAMEGKSPRRPSSKAAEVAKKRRSIADPERVDDTINEQERMEQLIPVLRPFVEEFSREERSIRTRLSKAMTKTSHKSFRKLPICSPSAYESTDNSTPHAGQGKRTIWDALLSLPRTTLDAYQPLIHLNHIFTGKVVPSIDYYTTKLNLLTSLITENRAKLPTDFEPTSTAFVTFAGPADARRACKYLAVHPNNPLACLVTMAPVYSDIDWRRVMKSSLKVEFVKDWVVNIGVWGFTLFWLFPVSLLVGLVSIQNISLFWPTLKRYLDRHPDKSEILQSLIPTILVSLLSLLIPPILLLIAKKMHLIPTLSVLQDILLTRYYKFLVVNVLIFFCVGTAAMQSFLQSFNVSSNRADVIQVVADSFPTAGPFYVGWLIFSTALHGGLELSLFGLPLLKHPFGKRQVTPRKRTFYVRPLLPNFFYFVPNHLLVLHIFLLFAVLNPFVVPFAVLYFFVQTGVMKNQFIHVYCKNYEGDGKILLVRLVRYSLDGLVASHAVFLAYMVVLRKSALAGLAAFLIVCTILAKLILTRMCRRQFELDDAAEAEVLCNGVLRPPPEEAEAVGLVNGTPNHKHEYDCRPSRSPFFTIRLPDWINFSYATLNRNHGVPHHRRQHRRPNPFGPHKNSDLTEPRQLRESKQQHVEGSPECRMEGPSSSATNGHPPHILTVEVKEDPAPLNCCVHKDPSQSGEGGPVVRHPPLQPWDDQRLPDLPYDNPYYSRAIDNALWLPRNPIGLLDLDDTVDLKVSITVDETAGGLGSWTAATDDIIFPDEASGISNMDVSPLTGKPGSIITYFPVTLQEVDGTEEIDLPPVIAQRVSAGERDVERPPQLRRPTIRRQASSSDRSFAGTERTTRRRPSILDLPQPSSQFIHSSPTALTAKRARSGSVMSALQLSSPGFAERAHSIERGFVPKQPPLAADLVGNNASISQLSLSVPKLSRSQNISASQAIFHEVLEEEREAHQETIEEENAEQVRGEKSWFTSWLYWRTE